MSKGDKEARKWKNEHVHHLSSCCREKKKDKVVPINKYARDALESLPRAIRHDKVFIYHGKPITDNFRKSLISACEKSGLKYGLKAEGGFRFHDIRASVKTGFVKAGVDKTIRDVILGHALQGMDKYYIRPSDEDLRQAMDQYTKWLDDQINEVVTKTVTNGAI
jgi:integrase